MKINFYTKAVLTVIAVMLSVIAFKQVASPASVVHAAGDTPGFGFALNSMGFVVYDHAASTVTQYYGLGQKGDVTRLER